MLPDASAPTASPLGVYIFNLTFPVGPTSPGQRINQSGSNYLWNNFLFSADDSLLVMLGLSGAPNPPPNPPNPRPTHGAYLLDMLDHGNPGNLTTFYGVGGNGSPIMATAELLPTMDPHNANQVRIAPVWPPSPPAPSPPPQGPDFYLIPP